REPRLEVCLAERLVLAWHREDRRARERLRLLAFAHDTALDPPRIAGRRREEGVPCRLADRDELRVGPLAPDDRRRGAQRVVALVPLLAPDEQDRRGLARDLRKRGDVRTDADHVDVLHATLAIPARLPLGERDDRVVALVTRDVARPGAGERPR